MSFDFNKTLGQMLLEKIQRLRSEGEDASKFLERYAEWERKNVELGIKYDDPMS